MTKEELEHIIFCYSEVVLFENGRGNAELVLQLEYNYNELIEKYHTLYGGPNGQA
jgi:hypothetical protein